MDITTEYLLAHLVQGVHRSPERRLQPSHVHYTIEKSLTKGDEVLSDIKVVSYTENPESYYKKRKKLLLKNVNYRRLRSM